MLKAAVYKIIFKIFTNCLYNKEDIRKIRKSKILQILQNFGHVTSVDWCFTFILRFITLYSLLVHLPLDRCTITWGGETIAMVARQMERPGKGNIPYHKRFWVHWRLGVLPCWSTNAPVQVRLNQKVFGIKKWRFQIHEDFLIEIRIIVEIRTISA